MSTYVCKCGKEFQKNIGAPTAPHRMPEYGPDHDCFGCPFVRTAEVFDPFMNQISKVAECRGVRVEGENLPEISDSILKEIKEAKALARKKTEKPADTDQVSFTAGEGAQTGRRYIHANWVYYVKQREDNGKFTAFFNFTDAHEGENLESPVATIPDFETFEQAQNALDGYAMKHGYEKEGTTGMDAPGMEQPEDAQEGFGPDGMEELAEYEELTQPDAAPVGEISESGNDGADSGDGGAEQPPQPCDWKNASGDEDGEQEQEIEDPGEPLPEGPDLSLRLPAFDPVFNTADDSLRDMVRTLKTKYIESGELTVKIVLNNYNGTLKPDPKKCKVDCALKPAKVSTSVRFPDDLEIAVEKDGRVIIPEDREHQISFDEAAAPSGTATVDGNTGIVEDYEEDGGEESNVYDLPPEDPESDSEDTDFEGDQDAQEDQPPYADGDEIESEDNAS